MNNVVDEVKWNNFCLGEPGYLYATHIKLQNAVKCKLFPVLGI